MRVFQNLTEKSNIVDVALAILAKAKQRKLLGMEWSCAELMLDSEDYTWLKRYIFSLDSLRVRDFIRPEARISHKGKIFLAQPVFGLVLIVFESEVARREAKEGTIWPVLFRSFSNQIRYQLFLQNYNPTQLHKDILERTANLYKLRNVFGQDGVCEWLNSIYLQFGFTHSGFKARLHEWLAGVTPPIAVSTLLKVSDSFKDLWNALQRYSRKNLKREILLKRLEQNPWVLPEWHEELLAVAERQVERQDCAEEKYEYYFLSEPEVVLDVAEAYFTTTILNLSELELTEGKYYVQVNGRREAELIRQSAGGYEVFPEVVKLGFCESALVEIVCSSGEVIQHDFLELLDSEQQVTVYSLTSRTKLRDALTKGLSRNCDYLLILNEDMQIQPSYKEWYQGGRKLLHLPKNWALDTVITLDNEPYWKIQEVRKERKLPKWSEEVRIQSEVSEYSLRKKFNVKVKHPSEIEVLSARFCGRPVALSEIEFNSRKETRLGPLQLTFQMAKKRLPIAVRLRKDRETCVIEADLAPVYSCAMFKSQSLERDLDEYSRLQTKQFSSGQLKISATVLDQSMKRQPEDIEQKALEEWGLVEGNQLLKRLKKSEFSLGSISNQLVGLGAPLQLIRGPYNSDSYRVLVRSIVDTGVIKNVTLKQGDLAIELYNPIEPSSEHQVVLMDSSGRPHLLQPESDDGRVWRVVVSVDAVAVAIAYRGARLGCWGSVWDKVLSRANSEDVQQIAALVRWMGLPVLSEELRSHIKAFYEAYPREVTSAWIHNKGLLEGLQFSEAESDRWCKAMREVVGYLAIDDSLATAVFDEILEGAATPNESEQDKWRRAIYFLLDINPVFMGKILLRVMGQMWAKRQFLQDVLKCCEKGLLEDISEYKETLEDCSRKMKVDTGFTSNLIDFGVEMVERGEIGDYLVKMKEKNLRFAVNNNRKFRTILALKILEKFLRRLSERAQTSRCHQTG